MRILFITFLFFPVTGFFQTSDANRTNYWYFGNGAGLKFSSGSPVAITDGALHTFEGTASISDVNGQLIMYTDGDTVWDRFNNPMPNGNQLSGCPNLGSTIQSSIIVPKPENTNFYYIFTADCSENSGALGIRYNVVDLTLNNGLGDIISDQKNILMNAPNTEGLAAIRSCDGNGYWIMSHNINTNEYLCYFLGKNGLNLSPVISTIGGIHSDYVSYFKFSPNGKKFAAYNFGGVCELFDFDNSNGKLSNLISLPDGGIGTCFSNDSSKLYFTKGGNYIIQYDLNSNDVPNSLILYYDLIADNSTYGAMENSRDGLILISSYDKDSISTLLSPNELLTSQNVARFNVFLNGRKTSRGGISNFVQNYFIDSADIKCIDHDFTIANSFSPNDDGLNDFFYIEGLEPDDNVRIYNRWGKIVYEFKSILDSWNGLTFNGEKCNDGIYYYLIKHNNVTIKNGCIHIFR